MATTDRGFFNKPTRCNIPVINFDPQRFGRTPDPIQEIEQFKRFELSTSDHGSGHDGVSRLICGITSAPKRWIVSSVKRGSIPGQSTMNHMNSVPNSS